MIQQIQQLSRNAVNTAGGAADLGYVAISVEGAGIWLLKDFPRNLTACSEN